MSSGVHVMEDVIIHVFYDIDSVEGRVFSMGGNFVWPAKCCFYLAMTRQKEGRFDPLRSHLLTMAGGVLA